MNHEPSVLDYVKSLFRGKPIAIPAADQTLRDSQLLEEPPLEHLEQLVLPDQQLAPAPVPEAAVVKRFTFPWRSLVALGLAIAAQISLQPGPSRTWMPGVILYVLSAGCLVWAVLSGELKPAELPEEQDQVEDYRVRARWLYASLPLALAAFLTLGGNRFNAAERHFVGIGNHFYLPGILAGRISIYGLVAMAEGTSALALEAVHLSLDIAGGSLRPSDRVLPHLSDQSGATRDGQ